MLVVEGCINDDKTILGGKGAFMSHFCNFFSFNACHSASESYAIKNMNKVMTDGEHMDNKINNLMDMFDK